MPKRLRGLATSDRPTQTSRHKVVSWFHLAITVLPSASEFAFPFRFHIEVRSHRICPFLGPVSLGIMSSRSIHIVANGGTSSSPVADQLAVMDTSRHLCPRVRWQTPGCSHTLATVNRTAGTAGRSLFQIPVFFPWSVYPEAGLLDPMAALFLFLEPPYVFYVALPGCLLPEAPVYATAQVDALTRLADP